MLCRSTCFEKVSKYLYPKRKSDCSEKGEKNSCPQEIAASKS